MIKISKKDFLKIHEECLGIVTSSCKKAGIGRTTFYSWLKSDEDFREKVREIEDVQGDFVETQLLKAIKEGDTQAIIFYCKTKLKNRGYTPELKIDADVKGHTIQVEVIDNRDNVEQRTENA